MNDIVVSDLQAATAAKVELPRVTLADLESKIAVTTYLRGDAGTGTERWRELTDEQKLSLTTMTVCVLVMQNGFTILGKSAPASPGNFNTDLGRKFAREDAMRQAWAFEGYLLRQRLHDEQVRRRQGEQV